MIATSQGFTLAAVDVIRKPKARVTITWTDSTIDTSLAVSANDENRTTFTSQVVDSVDIMSRKWFHFDGVTPFSEATYFMPSDTAESRAQYQIGWWGAARCGADSTWGAGPNPLLTVSFDVRPVRGLKVVGDTAWGEYPVDFNINIYNGLSLVQTVSVTGNNSVTWEADVSALGYSFPDVTKMELEVIKWSRSSRVVKITEFYTPIVQQYSGDDILDLTILEETDFENGTLPVGNISSNEISIKLQNADGLLWPDNDASDINDLIKHNRKISVELGFDIGGGVVEWVPMGVYWSGDWDTPEHEIYASTTARDNIDRLRKIDYKGDVVKENQTLYDIAESILQKAAIDLKGLQYSIDTALQSIIIPVAYFEPMSYAKALQIVAASGLCYVYADRYGVVRVEQ